jgi:hypothetical protein
MSFLIILLSCECEDGATIIFHQTSFVIDLQKTDEICLSIAQTLIVGRFTVQYKALLRGIDCTTTSFVKRNFLEI